MGLIFVMVITINIRSLTRHFPCYLGSSNLSERARRLSKQWPHFTSRCAWSRNVIYPNRETIGIKIYFIQMCVNSARL